MITWGWGQFTPTLIDVVRLAMMPIFEEASIVGAVLEEESGVKLRYLTFLMTASRTSRKSTYVTWLSFDERDGNKSGYVVETFLTY